MSESKNVIAKLEKIADEANPWKDNPPLRCDIPYLLLLSAIKLLKAQEPRVLTLYEVRTAEDYMEPVFLEMNAERESPDVFSWRIVKHIVPLNDEDIYVLDNVWFSSALHSEYYGITWRCWNKMPTYEQQKEAKWDEG